MQLIAALIFIAIFVAILGACLYFGRHQQLKAEHYGSWSQLRGGRMYVDPLDVREQLEARIAQGQSGGRARRRSRARQHHIDA